jgi:hypothetical protein
LDSYQHRSTHRVDVARASRRSLPHQTLQAFTQNYESQNAIGVPNRVPGVATDGDARRASVWRRWW